MINFLWALTQMIFLGLLWLGWVGLDFKLTHISEVFSCPFIIYHIIAPISKYTLFIFYNLF